MGIYIRGFKMPEGGYRTIEIAYDADGYPMAITDGGDVFDVIPVSSHGRLIDADALTISTAVPLDGKSYQYVHIDNIKAAPTIIPAERKENKND